MTKLSDLDEALQNSERWVALQREAVHVEIALKVLTAYAPKGGSAVADDVREVANTVIGQVLRRWAQDGE